MYERMLNKNIVPTLEDIENHLGQKKTELLKNFDDALQARYDIVREIKFPFGSTYGWGFKYAHKTSHLCYVFFEKNSFTITFQIGAKGAGKVEKAYETFLPKTKELWQNRYLCGNGGGWIHYRVMSEEEIFDVLTLLKIRKKPILKSN